MSRIDDRGPIAIWASEEERRQRIGSALDRADYRLGDCSSTLEALGSGASAVVACTESDPVTRVSALRACLGDIPLIMVVGTPDEAANLGTGRLRCEGLVYDHELEQTLAASVDAVLADQMCVPRAMREALAQPVLSHREKQVLQLVLSGYTNGQIADQLYLSESTVKSHLGSSFRKLGVSSRAEASRRMLDPVLRACSGHSD